MKKVRLSTLVICLVLVVILLPILPSCGTSKQENVIKIGQILNLQNSMGVEQKNGSEVAADIYNRAGGIKVGNTKYKIQIITYDSQNVQATAVAAANRLIFEDKVKFILHDPQLVEAYLPITEQNKVILVGGTASQATVKPGLNYSCFGGGTNFAFPIALAWYVKKYPDNIKNYVFVAPDDANGHFSIDNFMAPILESLGVKPVKVFYPAGQTDLSAVGTKVVSLNPTTVDCSGGGNVQDVQAVKAVITAGYKGQIFTGGGVDAATASQFLTAEQLTRVMCTGRAMEFEPPSTSMAKQFVDGWKAYFGKWEFATAQPDDLYALLTAIQTAGTITDTDKIIGVIYKGMKYEALGGPAMMVARSDLGDATTTRDSVTSNNIKTFKDSKPVLVATISPEEGLNYYKMVHPEFK